MLYDERSLCSEFAIAIYLFLGTRRPRPGAAPDKLERGSLVKSHQHILSSSGNLEGPL